MVGCAVPRSAAYSERMGHLSRSTSPTKFVHAGLTLHDVRSDGPTGLRFVLVHGIGAGSRYFSRLAPVLSRVGAVHTLELPGYGRTPKGQQIVTVEGLAEITAAYLSTLPPVVTVLIGHSMGAQTVAEVARTRPSLASAWC